MLKEAYQRYKAVQKQLEIDEEYRMLKKQQEAQQIQFQAVMRTLTERQQQIITEFIGTCAELDERELEIACFV